jgi:hypothetical protein
VGDIGALTDAIIGQLARPRGTRVPGGGFPDSEAIGEENLDATLRLYREMLVSGDCS